MAIISDKHNYLDDEGHLLPPLSPDHLQRHAEAVMVL